MRTRLIGLALVLMVAAGLGLTARHMLEALPAAPAASPAVPVIAGTVVSHDVPIYLRGVGTVIAYNNVVVRSQITGQIVKIAFTQGQAVHKGDLLAEIDPRPYQAQLDQAIANRDRDQAQVGQCPGQPRPLPPAGGQGLRDLAARRHPEGATGPAQAPW